MKVNIRLFAGLHELLGERNVSLELKDGATVADLRDTLAQQYPVVLPYLPTLVCAVDEEYATPDQRLKDGDEVALIPPVSGGTGNPGPGTREDGVVGHGSQAAGDGTGLIVITREPLDAEALGALVRKDESGAVAVFHGVARDHSEGRRVIALEYDAYPEMAQRKLAEVADEVRRRFPITDIAVHHRIGRLAIGEASLVVAVSSPHRKEAFAACEYAVDRLKETVPIWKKEIWEDGEGEWVAGHPIDMPAPVQARRR